MTFLDNLKAHVGGLVRIKTELYWYDIDEWDGEYETIYLLLDAHGDPTSAAGLLAAAASTPGACTSTFAPGRPAAKAFALLAIDGAPKWIWVYDDDVELIK